MTTFSHSGNLGDIIYSLPVVKHFGGGDFHIKIGNVPNVIRKYNNGPVPAEYEGKLSESDYKWLAPLLESQDYVKNVSPWNGETIDYDLDEFRGTVGQSFTGNFLETYFKTFKIDYKIDDVLAPWLTVAPKMVAPLVVTRTFRWRSDKTSTIKTWLTLIRDNKLADNAVFIGLPHEHDDFQKLFNVKIPYYKCRDFLDMAEVIAGCNMFLSNQTFAYGIAQGLGKSTVLETLTFRPLQQNECFFPRTGCFYF
jgi:hypothetical protein